MSDAFTKSLYNKTDPSPYNQAIFLSQDMINKAFQSMWELTPSSPPAPMRNFTRRNLTGKVDIQLDAPTVKLMVTTRGDPQLLFMMNMNGGTIKLFSGEDFDNIKEDTFPVAGWKFAFAVKINQKILSRDDPRATAAITNAGLSPDVYSLAQLYLDTSASSVNTEEYNDFGGYAFANSEQKATLMAWCQIWWKAMQVDGKNVIGYSVQAQTSNTGNVEAATFPPTSIDYFVYPWQDPSVSSPRLIDGDGKNALCYLMMSHFRTPPSLPGLAYSGAFVTEGSLGGLYVMNSNSFWNDWLIPLLQGLNKGAEVIPDEPYGVYDPRKEPQFPYIVSMRYHAGVNKSHGTTDQYYAFKKDQSHVGKWTWSGKKRTSSKTVHGSSGVTEILTQTSITSTELSFAPGGKDVVLKGKTVFTFNAQFTRNGSYSGTPSHMDITADWYFKMALSSVNDGGIQFARVPTPNDKCKVTVRATQGSVRWKFGFESLKQQFSSTLNNYLDNDTHQIENALLLALRGQDKLILPASGTFLMRNPKFNARGDLLVNLKYKNFTPPTAPWRSNLMVQSRIAVPTKASVHGPVPIGADDDDYEDDEIQPRIELKENMPECAIRTMAVDLMCVA
ncbi:hypothetical protein F4777DRAFT_319164 [Nemania sp. FL0916]|nr:hypothetical protein F4777DRAFT_319164 [Nemania sp. FL0916]